MATSVVSGFLDINNGGAPFDDIALKVAEGRILAAYNEVITTKGRHIATTIPHGKSAQFPVIGRVSSDFHTRGEELTFEQVNSNEVVITIQDLLVAPIFIDVLDEAKGHFEIRGEYLTQMGQELAVQDDKRVLMSMIAGSRETTPNFTGGQVGTPVVAATARTDGSVLKAAVYDAAEQMDENFVMSAGRSIFLAPAQYSLLLQDGEFLDADFGGSGNGSRSAGVVRQAAGFDLIKTTNLNTTDEQADTDFNTRLRIDYSDNVCVASHNTSVGVVSLMGLSFETDWDSLRQGTRLIAKYAKGYDYLRPEANVAIDVA